MSSTSSARVVSIGVSFLFFWFFGSWTQWWTYTRPNMQARRSLCNSELSLGVQKVEWSSDRLSDLSHERCWLNQHANRTQSHRIAPCRTNNSKLVIAKHLNSQSSTTQPPQQPSSPPPQSTHAQPYGSSPATPPATCTQPYPPPSDKSAPPHPQPQ